MTTLNIDHPAYFGDVCEVLRLFIREKHISAEYEGEGLCVEVSLAMEKDAIFTAKCYIDGNEILKREYVTESFSAENSDEYKKLAKRGFKIAVYRLLSEHFGVQLPWGCLTGIRPTKLLRETQRAVGAAKAERMFKQDFHVSTAKYDLTREILNVQNRVLPAVGEKDLDVYVGIPYCTSKCAYCSFSSGVTRDERDTEVYTQQLLKQIKDLSPLLTGMRIRSIYVGGGTPTALSDEQLKSVLNALPGASCEFTVEAGRPDTITQSKLDIIEQSGANRISVNAQTLEDATLNAIGREHSVEEFYRAFELAKTYPFKINADIIVGLPGEGESEFLRTLDGMINLDPHNITVHTLAVKKGSKFAEQNEFADMDRAGELVDRARDKLQIAGYNPYYMYRQKYMTGNLENVGYSKPGSECIYNIDIMEEIASVLAIGAGGISKRVYPEKNLIKRGPCVKDIKHYVARTAEMTDRMRTLFS